MQAQVYDGYFENGHFYTSGRTIRIPERKRVFITVIDEPIADMKSDKKLRAEYLERLSDAVALSMDEELIYIPRSKEIREPIIFADHGL
jgi:hypothetical protein